MYVPQLVETQIKSVLNYNLQECHEIKLKYNSFLFNFACLLFIIGLIGIILYYKYKGQINIKEKKRLENEKRDYILYNLRKFQNIKNKYITNIPFD